MTWLIGTMVILAVVWFWSSRRWLERGVRSASAVYHSDLGIKLSAKGKLADAIEEFREAIRIKPDYAEAYANLGLALGGAG